MRGSAAGRVESSRLANESESHAPRRRSLSFLRFWDLGYVQAVFAAMNRIAAPPACAFVMPWAIHWRCSDGPVVRNFAVSLALWAGILSW